MHCTRPFKPSLEFLDDRVMLAIVYEPAIAHLNRSTGMLNITGTPRPNFVTVNVVDSSIRVGGITNGKQSFAFFPTSSIRRIYFNGGLGDDKLICAPIVKVPVTAIGGPSTPKDRYTDNDTLVGGNASDLLIGGTGDDVFVGQGGVDTYKDNFAWNRPVARYDATDVVQTDAPLCAIASALAGAAYRNVFASGFIRTTSSAQTYQVTLHTNGHPKPPISVTFDGSWNDVELQPTFKRNTDGSLLTYGSGSARQLALSPTGEFWTILAARAYLSRYGINPLTNPNPSSWTSSIKNPNEAVDAISPFTPGFLTVPNVYFAEGLGAIFDQEDTLNFQTTYIAGTDITSKGRPTLHAFAILSIGLSPGNEVTLYNPWGRDVAGPGSPFRLSGADDGYITISALEFYRKFRIVFY